MMRNMILAFILTLQLRQIFFRQLVVAVQIKTEHGILDGLVSRSRNGTQFYSFYSIPFAKPPIDELRFEPPKDADSWEGVRDAKTPPPVCIQMDEFNFHKSERKVEGGEDCLYLNVFTPNISFKSLLPVMVYIHGGAFHSGGSVMHRPEYLMDHPVVVVTIQYRLAIFGFLSAADEVLPGNYGMKDQVAALKWLQKNIGTFGGDPKRVTIAGESAGGASVHFHLHSPLSAGLFHRAISQSGSALAVWAVIESQTAKNRARAVGVLCGCAELESKVLMECLRKVPAEQLVMAHRKFFIYDFNPPISFGPVVEPKRVDNAFLVEDPWKVDVVNSVPWIVGSNADDGGVVSTRIRSLPTVLDEWRRHYDRMIPIAFYYADRADIRNLSATSASIKKFYFGDNDIDSKTGKNLLRMFTDGYFAVDTIEAALRHNNKVFYYLYDHRNEHTFNEIFGNITEELGVCHADDLISLFHLQGMFPPVTEGPDYIVSQKMVNYWVNFMEKGDPNGEKKIWQPFGQQNFEYLHIKTDVDVMKEKLLHDKYIFWMDTLFSSIHRRSRIKTEL